MEDIGELKLLERILLLIKDYNDTYKPELYDSKVDLKAVKRSWIKNEDYGTMELRHWEIGLEEVQDQIKKIEKHRLNLDYKQQININPYIIYFEIISSQNYFNDLVDDRFEVKS